MSANAISKAVEMTGRMLAFKEYAPLLLVLVGRVLEVVTVVCDEEEELSASFPPTAPKKPSSVELRPPAGVFDGEGASVCATSSMPPLRCSACPWS